MKKSHKTIVFVILLLFALLFLMPILFVVLSTFRTTLDLALNPQQLIPAEFTLRNYETVLFKTPHAPVLRWIGNSILVSTIHTAITLVICSMAAFAFGRMKFRGREFLFWLLMSTMMIPQIVSFIPLYKIMSGFGLINTFPALIIPGVENAFNIFLIRQFMMGIPFEVEESAIMDGANSWTIFTKLILPLTKPALFVVGLFAFRSNWNSLLWPLVATDDIGMRTVTSGLTVAMGAFETDITLINTINTLSAIPVLIVFIIAQKYFIQGISLSSGMKE